MRRALSFRLLLVAALPLLAGCGGSASTEASAELAPEFRLPSLSGELLGPVDYPGKVLVLDFWATWCTPCRAQAMVMERLHAEFAGREVEFLAVSVGENRETVASYVARSPFPYPVLMDSLEELSERLLIYALPTVMVIDRARRVVYFQPGLSPASKLRPVVEEALQVG